MNWTFGGFSLMIILMRFWMGSSKPHSGSTMDYSSICEKTCKKLSSHGTCDKKDEENGQPCKNNCKDIQNHCKSNCEDLLKNQMRSRNAELLQRYIIQSSGNVTYHIEYSNCTECQGMCRDCLNEGSNSTEFCQGFCSGVCSPCILNNDCERILLIDGGFTGQIQSTCNNSNDNSGCQHIYDGSSPFNGSTCILSFETDPQNITTKHNNSVTNEPCRFSDSGVWLLNNNNTYEINITRQDVRPRVPICFVTGNHSCNWTSEWTMCSRQTHSQPCENITCVDPNTFCEHATYTNCPGNSSNDDIIILTGSPPICRKCGDPYKKTEGLIPINFTFPLDTSNSNTSYSNLMKNLTDMILKEMENKSSATLSLGDIKGIVVKPPTEELNSIYFMYSSLTQFNIIEDESQMPTFHRTFSVPKEALEKAVNMSVHVLFTSLLRFPIFPQDNMNSTLLNNEVYSIDMGEEISNLTDTFNLTFRNINPNDGSPLCHSWNGQGSKPNWTTDGCNTSYINGTATCACQHLTFFAVLMTPHPQISNTDLNNLTYITSIGCGLSLFFLSIALFMHFLLRKGRASVSVHILINLFLALFLLNLSFLVNQSVANTKNVIGCKLMAGVMHYSMLSTFTWFGLQALHLCLQLAQNVSSIQNYITKLSIVGWVPPALVVTGIFISQKYDRDDITSNTGKTVSMCWITDPTVHYVVNIGYYSAIFLFTLLTFVVMLRWLFLLRSKRPTIPISGKKSRPSDALTIMGLCSVLGLSWGFAFFAYGPMQIPAFYIFTILNSFQGFFLFIYYYKSSMLVGEAEENSSSLTEASVVENPYGKPKQF